MDAVVKTVPKEGLEIRVSALVGGCTWGSVPRARPAGGGWGPGVKLGRYGIPRPPVNVQDGNAYGVVEEEVWSVSFEVSFGVVQLPRVKELSFHWHVSHLPVHQVLVDVEGSPVCQVTCRSPLGSLEVY